MRANASSGPIQVKHLIVVIEDYTLIMAWVMVVSLSCLEIRLYN